MKLSDLYRAGLSKRKGKAEKARGKEESERKERSEAFQAHLLAQLGVVPHRGPSEFGDMRAYANLDRGM